MQTRAQQQDIFTTAPFASCHASTVVELHNGDLLASWFGGTAEGRPDVAIWSAQRHDGVWSAPREVVREHEIATFNPVLFHTRDGRLWLYYKYGPHPTSWSAGRLFSTDEGATWSKPEHLPAGILGPIRAKPLILADGIIVSGSSIESYHSWAAWIERSRDNGRTWSKIGPITAPAKEASAGETPESSANTLKQFDVNQTIGIIQPSVVELPHGRLRFYARSTAYTGKIVIADSKDRGKTWSPSRAIDVPNPNSGIDAVSLKDGRVVLVYNDTPKGRTPLNLAISRDGEHFTMFKTLESGPGEFSYPSMIVGKNGDLHITYTWNRKHIRYFHLVASEIPR
ncbi:MAG TPA: sialidase family protein [Edaphobacter sp.]|nr:sialidase family protein [Edaphobacter sp.]